MLPTQLKPHSKHRLLFLLGVLILTLGQMPSNVWAQIYVKWDAGGANNGTSWTDAYTDLQSAISSATSGDKIWVAQGTYYPGTNRTDSFALKDGVEIYGGFIADGTETIDPKDTRDDKGGTKTILSGDIDGNDIASPITDVSQIQGDNSCQVVTIDNTVSSSARLDSFTITGGSADYQGTCASPGKNNGGGIYNDAGDPTLKKLKIDGNYATNWGGGMYNSGDPSLNTISFRYNEAGVGGGLYNDATTSTSISGGTFSNNTATGNGGGIYNNQSNPSITRVSFISNEALSGGGIYNNQSNITATISRCTFKSNTAGSGGGIYNEPSSSIAIIERAEFRDNSASSEGGGIFTASNITEISNSLFSGNEATSNGGAIFARHMIGTLSQATISGNQANGNGGGIYTDGTTDLTINNSVLWQNGDTDGIDETAQIHTNSGTVEVYFSIVEGSWSGTGSDNLNSDPLFVTGIAPTDAPTTTGDFHLSTGSPALDSGDNTLAPGYSAGPPPTADVDLDGQQRIVKNVVDRGAYETQFPSVLTITCDTPSSCGDTTTPRNETSFTFQVKFDEDVSGVDLVSPWSDFTLNTTLTANITGVTQDNATTYTVTVAITGSGEDTLRLDVVDDDTIVNGYSIPLGNIGLGNGDTSSIAVKATEFEIYTIDTKPPTIVSITDVSPDPIDTSIISIEIVFSEAIKDFALDDLSLTRDGNPVSFSGQTLTNPSLDKKTWILSDLTNVTGNDGSYTLTVTATGITDNAGNAVTADGTETWTKLTNPTLDTNTGLTLSQGTSATITNTMLQVSDSEQGATDLTYTIGTTIPANGTLKLNGTALSNGDTFTQDDIDNNKLTYEHDNSSTTNDSFDFTVSDGAGGSITNTTFSITITTTPNTSPSLDTNTGLTLDQGSNTTITNTQLQTTDNEQGAADLTYTIDAVPTNGTLKLNGTALNDGDTFTQDDLDNNRVTYEHDNSSTTSDSFTFTVADGAGGSVASTPFDITINPVSNTPDSPTNLTATAVSQTQINLAWVDNSDDETGFKIQREGTLIHTTAANVESYSDTGLTCNTTYTYQVIATNGNGDSTTIEASATTYACSSGGGSTPLPSKLYLTIKFDGKGSGSIKSDPSGIDCDNTDDSCSQSFSAASTVTLTPTAAEGSEFSSWSGNSDCGDGKVVMTSSISCTAFFQLLPATLAVTYEGNGTISSSPSGIDCGDACTNAFDGGSEVTLTATPDDGWTLDSWTGDCNSSGQVTIDSGKACHAIFVEEVSLTPPYLKVTKTGEGTITSEPAGIDCGEECLQEYTEPGTEVILTATPDDGWIFDQWDGDCDDNGQITITDQGDQCEAIFVQTTVPFVLNVAITGQGSVTSDPTGIDCGETCSYDYQSGQTIALTPTPDNGWDFEGWRGHCDENGQVVLDGEFNFKQCRAVFIESTEEVGLESKALALEIVGNGTVTSQPTGIDCKSESKIYLGDCTEDYTNDTEVTLTSTPDTDWRFEGWAGDCNSDGYVFVDSEKLCEAIFVDANAEPFTLNVAITGKGSVTSEPSGIDCGTTCAKEFATGLEIALNATPDKGWEFEGWRGHCDEAGYVTLDGEFNFKQCRAVFVEASKAEALDSNSESDALASESESKALALEITGFGTVTSQPSGIDCGNDCFEDYDNDIEVTLTPTPDSDWRFEGWAGDCDSNGYVFVDSAKSCEAIFVDANAEPFTLNVAITGKGSVTSQPTGIDCGTTCAKDYASGLEMTLNATPDDGWEFEGWRGHCDETGHVTLDGDFNFKQCRAVFVESTKIEEESEEDELEDSETGIETDDNSEDDDSETNSDSSSNDDSETNSDSSSDEDSETGSISDEDSGTNSDSSTNTSGNSQTGTSATNQTTGNNQTGVTNSVESVGPNGGDGNNDGTLDSQQNNVLSLQNANGEYVTIAEKNGCAINPNGNNLEFNCSQADVDNYYYGVSDPSEVPQCQEPQVICQVITIQGQQVVVANTTLNDGDANDSVANDGKITQSLAPGQNVVQETNISSQNANANGTSSGNATPASTGNTTGFIEEIDINLQSVATVIEVGEIVNFTVGGIDGIFFIKEMPELALVSVDEEAFVNSNGELTLIGLAVGETQMILSDQLSSQEVTLYIKVLPPVTLEEINASKDIGLKTRLTTLKVGQTVTLMIADGQGMLSMTKSPDEDLISLSDWIAYGDGTADVTLRGIQAGSTQLVVKDSATPPQQTTLNIIVIGKPTIGNQSTNEQGLDSDGTETKPTPPIKISFNDCEPINSLGIDALGNPFESKACFTGKVSSNGVLQSNVRQLTHQEAQTLRISARIQVAPEHLAQPAEILLVGVYSPSKGETTFYTRDKQTWFVWDEQISSLITAQEHPILPELVDVFIFEGDLSFMPGEFTVYVGYRLLENGTIIYNDLEPIHFFVGNR